MKYEIYVIILRNVNSQKACIRLKMSSTILIVNKVIHKLILRNVYHFLSYDKKEDFWKFQTAVV